MNLTRHPCRFDEVNNPDGIVYVTPHGDFWVSDPIEDIAPGYIDDFRNRASYTIDGTDTELEMRVNTLMPDIAGRGRIHRMFDVSNISRGRDIVLNFGDKINKSIKIFNCNGQMIFSASVPADRISIPSSVLGRGVNVIYVTKNNEIHSAVLHNI
ncbi:MAG: hypothetical protein GF350_04890 [Chitinivibrionales bacterium]|nr:hypothetical protein [Chitinivibrionales bacterium]